ncbi:MAG: DsrE family protein [Verrucomicrobia bacterium]|nr:DsrE family protein [Verrucomicrobiota bacterium]
MPNEPTPRKMALVCNHAEASSVMPTLIMASSGLSLDYELFIFVCPAASSMLLKGELEKLRGRKGMPDPVKLYDDIRELGGRVILCELALEARDIKTEDLREGVEIMKAPSFLMAAEGATLTFAF